MTERPGEPTDAGPTRPIDLPVLMSAGPPRPGAEVPWPVLRQWSDALAAAGLYGEALQIHPAAERSDVVRRAELAVLAEDHQLALNLLAELKNANSARTSRPGSGPVRAKGNKADSRPVSPWLDLLTSTAKVQAGEPRRLPAVMTAAGKVQPSAGVSWIVALAAAAAGDLVQAAPAATEARAGGCRDLRMLTVLAADRAAQGADQDAVGLVAEALAVALPDEDPVGLVIDLLDRADLSAAAQRLAAFGAGDPDQTPAARAAWRAGARRIGAGRRRVLRRSLTAAGSLAELHRSRAVRRQLTRTRFDLTCRCYGSAGWIGPDRLHYVNHHLSEVLPAPVAGLTARLLRCRATGLTFLDLGERQLTLPVVSELAREQPEDVVSDVEADPEGHPTPGMGVSLGIAL